MSKRAKAREIRAEMVRLGISQTDIARKLKISQQAVSATVYGKKNARIEQALIEAGVPKEFFEDQDDETDQAA